MISAKTRHKRIEEFVGLTFNKWQVLEFAGYYKKYTQWKCRCSCGTISVVRKDLLVDGRSKKCKKCRIKAQTLRPYEALWLHAKRRAALRTLDWSISYEEFITLIEQNQRCHYCWAVVYFSSVAIIRNGCEVHLDRIENGRGYSLDNVVVACTRCNVGRNAHFSYEEWFGMTEYWRNRYVASGNDAPSLGNR